MIRMIQGFDELAESQDELVATAATIAVVGAGVIIFEAALLPGLVLGIATMLVPKYLPRLHPNLSAFVDARGVMLPARESSAG